MLRDLPSGGTGLLALFCNLDPRWHAEFRDWLVEDMFPARRAIGFPACASYDRIDGASEPTDAALRYLTLYAAPTLGDLYGRAYQGLRENRDARDAAFHQRFQDLDRATLAWVGPELVRAATVADGNGVADAKAGAGAPGFASVIVVDRVRIAAADLPAFNAWLVDGHLPACATVPGVRRVRRYLTMERVPDDGARHLLLHELDDVSVLDDMRWRALRSADGWRWTQPSTSSGAAWRRIVQSAIGA
jgi:hypothetical protein